MGAFLSIGGPLAIRNSPLNQANLRYADQGRNEQ